MRVAGGGGWSKRLTERAFVVSGWSGRERGTVGSAGQIAESGMESEYSGTVLNLCFAFPNTVASPSIKTPG